MLGTEPSQGSSGVDPQLAKSDNKTEFLLTTSGIRQGQGAVGQVPQNATLPVAFSGSPAPQQHNIGVEGVWQLLALRLIGLLSHKEGRPKVLFPRSLLQPYSTEETEQSLAARPK